MLNIARLNCHTQKEIIGCWFLWVLARVVELAWGRVDLLGGLLVTRAWEELLGFPLRPQKLQWRAQWVPSHLQLVCLNEQPAQSPPR